MEAVTALRAAGHRVIYVTNNRHRPRPRRPLHNRRRRRRHPEQTRAAPTLAPAPVRGVGGGTAGAPCCARLSGPRAAEPCVCVRARARACVRV